MKDISINGDTWEKGKKHLEIILNRMFRRLHNTIVGVMPKIPIMGFVSNPIDGLIGRYLIPGICKLVSFDVFIESFIKPEDADDEYIPSFEIVIKRGSMIISDSVCKDSSGSSISLNIDLQYEDILEIKTKDNVSNVSYTIVCDFGQALQTSQEYVIKALEQVLEENKLDTNSSI